MSDNRDWQADMKQIIEQYNDQLKKMSNLYAAEKERADKLEQQLAFTKEWAKATVAETEALQDQAEAREKKLREMLHAIAFAPVFDSDKVELERRRTAADKLLSTLYLKEATE